MWKLQSTPLPDEVPGIEPSKRKPCPECGSAARIFGKESTATVKSHAQIAGKAETPSEKKPFLEVKSGDDFHRDTGTFNDLERIIDRRNDRYHERIVDKETGAVIREVNEPLSDHVGRGLAKPKKDKPSGK
jgi:hypothetical protein